MAIKIEDDPMALQIDGRVIATAQFRQHAAADGQGAWIISRCSGRLFTRNQAITALTVIELLETGYADDNPLVVALGEDLR